MTCTVKSNEKDSITSIAAHGPTVARTAVVKCADS